MAIVHSDGKRVKIPETLTTWERAQKRAEETAALFQRAANRTPRPDKLARIRSYEEREAIRKATPVVRPSKAERLVKEKAKKRAKHEKTVARIKANKAAIAAALAEIEALRKAKADAVTSESVTSETPKEVQLQLPETNERP